jgi:hypothetical protein
MFLHPPLVTKLREALFTSSVGESACRNIPNRRFECAVVVPRTGCQPMLRVTFPIVRYSVELLRVPLMNCAIFSVGVNSDDAEGPTSVAGQFGGSSLSSGRPYNLESKTDKKTWTSLLLAKLQ